MDILPLFCGMDDFEREVREVGLPGRRGCRPEGDAAQLGDESWAPQIDVDVVGTIQRERRRIQQLVRPKIELRDSIRPTQE